MEGQLDKFTDAKKNKINPINKSIIWFIKEAFYLFLKIDFYFRQLTYLKWMYIWEKMRYIIKGGILNQQWVQYGSLTVFVLLNLNKKIFLQKKWNYSGTTKELQSGTFNHEGPGGSLLKQWRGNSYQGQRKLGILRFSLLLHVGQESSPFWSPSFILNEVSV